MADDFEIARGKIWFDTDKLPGLEDFIGEYLIFDQGKDNHNLDSYFIVGHVNEPPNPDKPDVLHTKIMFFQTGEDIEDHKPKFSVDSILDFKTAKEVVENTAKHFNSIDMFSPDEIKKHIDLQIYKEQQLEKLEKHFEEYPDTSKNNNMEKENIMSDEDEVEVEKYFKSMFEEEYPYPDTLKDNNLEKKNIMSENFEWKELTPRDFGGEVDKGDCLETYVVNKDDPSYFILEPTKDSLCINFFIYHSHVLDHKPIFYIDTNNLDINTAKNIIEKTTEHFSKLKDYNFSDMKEHIIKQFPERTVILEEYPEKKQSSDRELETAQKTGYVQGVCESVLAFNTDENRKIMSEDTMSFLSKKILSEMNVTKDMAQKFANPDTYKALEKSVFKQNEQHLEQTQSQGRNI